MGAERKMKFFTVFHIQEVIEKIAEMFCLSRQTKRNSFSTSNFRIGQ